YGQTETESVVSELREFTDTLEDTGPEELSLDQDSDSQVVALPDSESEFKLTLDCAEEVVTRDALTFSDSYVAEADEEEETIAPKAEPARRARQVERQATVRHYHRMNPEKMFPLLVILSDKKILTVTQRGVRQETGQRFHVEQDSLVEIEPI